jgi:hypothetical protein
VSSTWCQPVYIAFAHNLYRIHLPPTGLFQFFDCLLLLKTQRNFQAYWCNPTYHMAKSALLAVCSSVSRSTTLVIRSKVPRTSYLYVVLYLHVKVDGTHNKSGHNCVSPVPPLNELIPTLLQMHYRQRTMSPIVLSYSPITSEVLVNSSSAE